ncbi:MAG: trypsin-like peptidase domain-containing protein [Abditibacteriales bacterium]|nr:trypsin-like peptidase domain-containing protein [Abditibacteriales bacterium]MDW8366450.1 trypsin-like peptidase domain-containing protein [Abditibacteriales bacterium]
MNVLLAFLAGCVAALIFMGLGAYLYRITHQGISQFTGTIHISDTASNPFAPAVSKVGPAVVSIEARMKTRGESEDPRFRLFRDLFPSEPGRVQGSGVIFDGEKGYILTNAHVVENMERITVTLIDERKFRGKVIGTDPLSDIAVVQIAGGRLPEAVLGTADTLQPGAWVVAMGNPFGHHNTVTVGVVSAKGRNISVPSEDGRGRGKQLDNVIQTDASINPGNSGGPLCNLKGEVVGINTAIATPTAGSVGIGFAIPIDRAKEVAARLVAGKKVPHPYIGVRVSSVDQVEEAERSRLRLPDEEGAYVVEVIPGSPAAKAGLQRGDVIREIDRQKVRAHNDVVRIVRSHKVGDEVTIVVWRNGGLKFIKVKIGDQAS